MGAEDHVASVAAALRTPRCGSMYTQGVPQ
jgi:hypothetical protein